jgi:hypothetical protein
MKWEGILSHMLTPHTNAYAISFNNLISPFMLLCPLFFIHFVFPFWSFLKPNGMELQQNNHKVPSPQALCHKFSQNTSIRKRTVKV